MQTHEDNATLLISISYGSSTGKVFYENYAFHSGTTVLQAIQQSELLSRHPEIDGKRLKVGIFNQIVSLDTPVNPGDRIEIYRPLLIDPKEVRRSKARQQKT